MSKQFWVSLSAAVVVATVAMSVVGHAQTTASSASALVSAWHAQFSKGWTPPQTPGDDPDLQGSYTSIDDLSTPMERPAEFEGRSLNDITPKEMAERNRKGHEENASGGFGGPPTHWYEVEYQKNTRAWYVIEPVDGKIPPLTPNAAAIKDKRQALQASSRSDAGTDPATYLDWALSDRCIAGGSPTSHMIPGIHGQAFHLVQTRDYVTMRYEEVHETRIIPIKGRAADRPHLPQRMRPYFGDATAWFEGNTLVVETLYNERDSDVHGSPPETARTIERYTRRTNPSGIEYTATIENPDWWVRPWTWQQRMTEDDRIGLIFEYACHEDNHSMVNALAGARDKERRAAERAKREAEKATPAGR